MKKENVRRLIATLTIATTITGMANPITVQAATWKQTSAGWKYQLDDKSFVAGQWKQIGGTWYYFNSNGVMKTGWLNDGGVWYYLKPSGAMATGWVQDGNTWYYMDNSGAMATGWVKDGGTWYYMDASGAMKTGWVQDGNTWYYLKDSGAMATGWVKSGDTWYYMDASGAMKTGWVEDGGKKYYMDESGAMQIGWFELDENNNIKDYVSIFEEIPVTVPGDDRNRNRRKTLEQAVSEARKKVIYFGEDGAMATGWKDITTQYGNEKFYFDADGVMAIGTKQIDGQWYYFHKEETENEYTYVYGNKIGGWSLGAMQPLGISIVHEYGGWIPTFYFGWEIVNGITISYGASSSKMTFNESQVEFQRTLARNVDTMFESTYDLWHGDETSDHYNSKTDEYYTCHYMYYVSSKDRRSDGLKISTNGGQQGSGLNGYRNPEIEAKFEKFYREKFNIPDDRYLKMEEILCQSWGYSWESSDEDLDDMLVYYGRTESVGAYDANGYKYSYSIDDDGNIQCEKLDNWEGYDDDGNRFWYIVDKNGDIIIVSLPN